MKKSNEKCKEKKPLYMFQCVQCKKWFYSFNMNARHCGVLSQWISGVEGKGINVNSPKIKIQLGGYIEMSEENLQAILSYDDPHQGLIWAIHMGYCDSGNVTFNYEEKKGKAKK